MAKTSFKAIEFKILGQLEKDGRMSYSYLGKQIKHSQQQISYTVNSLQNKGILQKTITAIDYSKLGILNFRVYFRLNYVEQSERAELINYLVHDSHTGFVANCGGQFDLVCSFFTKNPSQFNKTLREIMHKFPKQLQNHTILTTVVIRHFGRKYFLEDPASVKELFIGGDREPEFIDKIDMNILNELSVNARKSSVNIAKFLAVTPKTVISRIKNLQDRDIILGYLTMLDMRKGGYIQQLLLIKYHNISSSSETKLISYLKTHPNVVNAVKTIGEWDIEITIESGGTQEFRNIEAEIRTRFAELIQQIVSLPLYQKHKLNYFPEFLLSES